MGDDTAGKSARDAGAVGDLLQIMARLRDPGTGCPWDLEQTFSTIAPYTVEEAYEVADAIANGTMNELADELGDLLFQVVFHAQMAKEAGAFEFADVVDAISAKMIRRHPHVFAGSDARTSAEQTEAWEEIKAKERAGRGGVAPGILDGVPIGLPALTRALKLSKRAARAGFVWASMDQILDKLREELAELQTEIDANHLENARRELGDVLFVCANIARQLDADPEACLRETNSKFVRRFSFIERALASRGSSPVQSDLAEMDRLWDEAKAVERDQASP